MFKRNYHLFAMPSFADVGTYIISNLLDEVGMNPTWEKYRKYVYAICVVISLYPLYLVMGLSVACQPEYLNGTNIETRFSYQYIQVYCRNDVDLVPMRYAGCFLQLANIVILVASFWWLHVPKVIDAIRTFAEIRTNILEMKLPIENLKALILAPNTDTDDDSENKRKLRDSCRLVPFVSNISEVYDMYFRRNVILLFVLLTCTFGFLILAISIGKTGNTFQCDCHTQECLGTYKCAVDSRIAVIVFTGTFSLGMLSQAATVAYGVWHTTRGLTEIAIDKEHRSIKLMLQLCRNSHPFYSGLLDEFIQYILSNNFHSDIKGYISNIVSSKDTDLVEIVQSFSSKTSQTPSVIFKYLESPDAEFQEDQYISIFKISKYSIEHTIPLAKLFVKHNLWKSLVKLLEYCNSDLNDSNDIICSQFNQMEINFDFIETPASVVRQLKDEPDAEFFSTTDGKSILYHSAVSTDTEDKASKVTKFLLNCCSPSKVYVHWETANADGLHKSMTLTDFITERTGGGMIEPSLAQEITRCQSKITIPNSNSLSHLLWQYKEFVHTGMWNEKNFAVMLKRKKFHNWDETASKFLKLACENKHQETGKALIRALFSQSPIKCLRHPLPNKEIFVDAVRNFEYELEDCKNLAEHLAQSKYWELFVYLLGNVKTDLAKCSQDILHFFKLLSVNVDFIEMPFNGEDRYETGNREGPGNLLLYACCRNQRVSEHQRQPYLAVANFILDIIRPQKLYIHKGLQSLSAVEYINRNVKPVVESNLHMNSKLKDLVSKMKNFEIKANKTKLLPCQQEVETMHKRYLTLLKEKENPTYNESLRKLMSSIACVKLQLWDENVKNFAKSAARNEHWNIVTSLLRGIILYDRSSPNSLTLQDEDNNIDIEFLVNAEAVKNIIECVKSNDLRQRKVDETAVVRYIISNCQQDQRKEIGSWLSKKSESYYLDLP